MLLFTHSNKSPLKSNIQFQQHILKARITVFFPTFSHSTDIFIKSSNQSHVAWPWLCRHSRVRYTPCTMLFYYASATVTFSHISVDTVNQYRPAVWHCVCKPPPCSSITLLQQLCSVTSASTLWISITQQYGTVCVSHRHPPPSPFCSSCAQFLQSFNFLTNIVFLQLKNNMFIYVVTYMCKFFIMNVLYELLQHYASFSHHFYLACGNKQKRYVIHNL